MKHRISPTSLLSVSGRISSFLWHSGEKLRETQSYAEIWHCAAEVEQIFKTVSKKQNRENKCIYYVMKHKYQKCLK